MSYLDVTVIVLSGLVVLILAYLAILTRQIALLHLRIQPTGARVTDMGLDIGTQLHPLAAQDIQGQPVRLIGDHRARLLLFVSPSCNVCHDLMPAVRAIAKDYRRGANAYDVVLITASEDREASQEFVRRHGLSRIPYVMSNTVAQQFQISGSPYAVVVDADGIVKTKGIVNSVEHMESLLVAPMASPTEQFVDILGKASWDEHRTAASD